MQSWKHYVLVVLFFLHPVSARAISVYPSELAISPIPHTTQELLTADVIGEFATPGFTLIGNPQLSISAQSIVIDFLILSPTHVVPQVLWPFSYSVELGFLAAGAYSITANFSVDGVFDNSISDAFTVSAIPVPAATWLFGSGLLALIGIARRKAA
jgi:hypothetical protein